MKKMRMAAFLMAAAVAAVSFTACGQGTGGGAGAAAGSSSGTAKSNDVYTVRVWGHGEAKSDDMNQVAAKINEITVPKIGVKVDLTRTNDSDKLNLAMTSGEKMDLVCLHGVSVVTMANSGRLLELDSLLDQYGKDIKTVIPDQDMACGKVGGKLYTIPSNNDNARAAGLAMRKSIVDELGIDYKSIDTFEKAHDVLVKVKKAHPELYPLVSTWAGGGMQSQLAIDNLGSGNSFGVLEDCRTPSTKVVNYYDMDSYKKFVKMMYQWNKEGLIMPDVSTSTENSLMGTVGFASFENYKPGKEVELQKANHMQFVVAPLLSTYKQTSLVGDSSFGIAASSEKPEKAMQLLSLMYTDPQVATLLVDGIEGKHYQVVDKAKNIIDMPSGVTAANTGYSSLDWAWPNEAITPVWKGNDANLWTQMDEFNKGAKASPALGFRFDSTNVMNEVTACQNVEKKYATALSWGALNPDEALPKFNSELKAVGLDTIIQEKQKQLDEWLKTQKK